jgi:hypothetical protein
MKTMSPVCDEKEWTAYVSVVMKSEMYEIELVVRMVVWNDVGDESSQSLTLPEAVDEQHIECSVVIIQSLCVAYVCECVLVLFLVMCFYSRQNPVVMSSIIH